MREEINNTLTILKNGGTILYPTDTVWGIGCDATNEKAVEKILAIKKRDTSKSLILLLHNENYLANYIKEVPPFAYDLIEMATSPLTIIYPDAKNLAPNVIAEDGSIAIRIVKEPFCYKLIESLKKPIVSTSANFSGVNSPRNFSEIEKELYAQLDYIVNLRRTENSINNPSSIIKLGLGGEIKIIRQY